MLRVIFGTLVACTLAVFAAETQAKNVLLVIGGGPDPGSNQWSLQRNVEFACKTLETADPSGAWDVQIYFADGPAEACDVQRKVADRPDNRAVWWLSLLANRREMPVMEYVDHSFPQGSQAATKDNLERGMRQLSESLAGGDRLLVYVTAHGGPAETGEYYGDGPPEDENPFNTTLALWGGETVDAAEFSRWLDRFHSDVELTLVMTQCYSGGFANVLFHNADRRQGLNPRPRCGFFAQRHDRVAAGCTAEIDESGYEEYSSSFWAALGGVDRRNKPLASAADYDGDGRITFNEAHAYTVLHSQTLDIPLRSSDVVLRKFSKIEAGDLGDRSDAESTRSGSGFFGRLFGRDSDDAEEPRDLPSVAMDTATTLSELAAAARPDQRAVLEGMAEKLGVASTTSLAELRDKRAGAKKAIDRIRERQERVYDRLTDSLSQLEERVQERWPQLAEAEVTYAMFDLASSGADELVKFVERQPAADAIEVRIAEIESLGDRVMTAEVNEARWQRLVHAAEVVALQNNLASHAPGEVVSHYRRLLELEGRGF